MLQRRISYYKKDRPLGVDCTYVCCDLLGWKHYCKFLPRPGGTCQNTSEQNEAATRVAVCDRVEHALRGVLQHQGRPGELVGWKGRLGCFLAMSRPPPTYLPALSAAI